LKRKWDSDSFHKKRRGGGKKNILNIGRPESPRTRRALEADRRKKGKGEWKSLRRDPQNGEN